MDFRFDPQERITRISTLVPAGQQSPIFARDELFRFGIEEEYFLSDAETFEVRAETPEALFQTADFGGSGHIVREFLQAQIEVATEPHCNTNDSSHELRQLRQTAAAAGRSMASSYWRAERIHWRPGASLCRARKPATPR